MTGKIIISVILGLLAIFAITRVCHYNKANKVHPDEGWGKNAVIWLIVVLVAIFAIPIIFIPEMRAHRGENQQEIVQGESEPATTDTDSITEDTVSGNELPEAETPETETEAPKEEAELPPEQGEDEYDEQYADILVGWEKTASEESRRYLPKREADMTDEEYKAVVITWLQSEDLDEQFIPRDLTEEEAILYAKEQLGEDFDINAVIFDRGCMPSSTTRRQNSVREQVQAYYNDPKLEGWSDAVLPSTTFQLFWDVYGTKNQHSDEWKALIAGKTVPAETWLERYDLTIEEDELDLDGFMEYAFWQPMLYQCVHNPVYADEKAQTLLLIEKQFPGWLDNAPSVEEYRELYDAAMETDDGITGLFCRVKFDDGHYETCVRPEVAVKGINVYLAYRRLEINAANPIQAKESTINFHLPPADGNYVRTEALTDPKDQESEPAFNLSLRYKNRKQAAELGVNVFDARDIIYIARKPAPRTPEKPTPTPPGPTPTPTPTPPGPTPTPTTPPPGKNPSDSTLDNGNDDTNDGPLDDGDTDWSEPGDTTETGDDGNGDQSSTTPPDAEKNNDTPQDSGNNGGANVDNGTPPDTSKPEERPTDNNNSGVGNDPPADDSYSGPPL